ncbi:MAG: iron-sulfur cluster assembly protein [Alphaproteobacteria bacterium]
MSEPEQIEENEAMLMEALKKQEELKDYVAKAGEEKPADEANAAMEDIIEVLKTVSDPEIMINVYDMGLIYNIDQKENGDVFIDMTVTAPTCPVAGTLPQEVADALSKAEGVGRVEVKLVWEPAWSFERLSDEAKMMFEMF